MKKLILTVAVLAATMTVKAQVKIFNSSFDEFTGDLMIDTRPKKVASSSTGSSFMYFGKINESNYLKVYSSSDLGCSGAAGNYIHFLFEDGTSLRLEEDLSKIDCSDNARSLYFLTEEQYEELKEKTVVKFRHSNSEYYSDRVWKGSQPSEFIEVIENEFKELKGNK